MSVKNATKKLSNLCWILPILALFCIPALAKDPESSVGFGDNSEEKTLEGTYTGYDTAFNGGVISVGKNGTLTVSDGTSFTGNKATNFGGAVFSYGTVGITKATFDGNYAANGGAILGLKTSDITISDSVFTNNTADKTGGAVTNYGKKNTDEPILTIENSRFENNKTNPGSGAGGGAINNYYGNIDKIINSKFIGNASEQGMGGAIKNQGKMGKITADILFQNNIAGNGGAIWNGADGGISLIYKTKFIGNKAIEGAGQGGAITNAGTINQISNSVFENNYAQGLGGAVANVNPQSTGKATLTFMNVIFKNNTAGESGGAIYNDSKGVLSIGPLMGDVGELRSQFIGNSSGSVGGAIRNVTNPENLNEHGLILVIKGADFVENSTKYGGGALWNQGDITSINDVEFRGNQANSGGALWNGANGVITSMSNARFINNKAGHPEHPDWKYTRGGAITNAGKINLIKDSLFENNRAQGWGGAVANMDPESPGGAAELTFEGATFKNNTATELGGAIYNDSKGEITFNGDNIFTGNKVIGDRGYANDIYNLGKITIADGITTIDGGITGNTSETLPGEAGKPDKTVIIRNGELDISEGATLNIGTAMIDQDIMNVDGTIKADIVNLGNYAKIFATHFTFGDNSKLNLNVAQAGTYALFNKGTAGNFGDVAYNKDLFTLTDTSATDGKLTFKTKDVSDVAQNNNLSNEAASVVVGLANAGSYNPAFARMSLTAQHAMNNKKYTENESSKLLPEKSPVVHSVSQTVQNQVFDLTAIRLGRGAIGRSGGDSIELGRGIWAQGLFNNTKFSDRFNGHNSGIAVGADASFNRKWMLGLGYAFTRADISVENPGARDIDIDSNSIFIYGQYKPNAWYINGTLDYGFADYDEKTTAFGTGLSYDHKVDSFGGNLMTGYDFALGLTPQLGARYMHVAQKKYNNGIVNVAASDMDFLTGVAGVKYALGINLSEKLLLKPEISAAALYDFMSDKGTAKVIIPGALPYVIESENLSRFGGEVGLGLTAQYRGLELSLKYNLDLHKDYQSHTGLVRLRYAF